MLRDKKRLVATWLSLVYISGALGIPFYPDFFLPFTPLTLIMGSILVFWFHGNIPRKMWFALSCIAVASWATEVAGVSTGLIFGTYSYGRAFGVGAFGVPFLIGLNWAVLLYCSLQWVRFGLRVTARWPLAILASSTMVALDVIMEAVAPSLNFWTFAPLPYAPLHNFIGWWALGFVLAAAFGKTLIEKSNAMALVYLALQVLFFSILALFEAFGML
jgi:uncharacterized membrane protein